MTIDFAAMFDTYGRQARLYPGLLTVLPPLLTLIAWYPDLLTSIGSAIVTFLASFGVFYALAVYSRSRGKKVEQRLLQSWGGWPTSIWLRHRSTFLPAQTHERYHRYLVENVPGLWLPTADDEKRAPKEADQAYASAVKWLVEQCRGKR